MPAGNVLSVTHSPGTRHLDAGSLGLGFIGIGDYILHRHGAHVCYIRFPHHVHCMVCAAGTVSCMALLFAACGDFYYFLWLVPFPLVPTIVHQAIMYETQICGECANVIIGFTFYFASSQDQAGRLYSFYSVLSIRYRMMVTCEGMANPCSHCVFLGFCRLLVLESFNHLLTGGFTSPPFLTRHMFVVFFFSTNKN